LVLNAAAGTRIFPVGAYTLGYVRNLSHGNGMDIGLGTQFTITNRPDALDRDDLGYAFEFFLRIGPLLHSHSEQRIAKH
jgi:hypothetical protein